MESLTITQVDGIRVLLETTAIQCRNVAGQQEPLSIYQMKKISKVLEETAIQCGVVAGQLSTPMDIVSWTLGRQNFFDQDQPVSRNQKEHNVC